MADNKTLWTWGNQQKYHEELMQEIEDNTGASTPVLNTSTGNPITITDGADAPLIELGVYGRSTQDGIPTPESPVDIVSVGDDGNVSVTACGKNLLDTGNAIKSADVVKSATSNAIMIKSSLLVKWSDTYIGVLNVEQGKVYTISGKLGYGRIGASLSSTGYKGSSEYLPAFGYPTEILKPNKNQQTIYPTETQTVYLYYCTDMENTGNNDGFALQLQVEAGNTATGFEPYKSTTAEITTGLPLCGIPVESGGNYTDSNGQRWVCDELIYNADGTGKNIKRIQKTVVDGINTKGSLMSYVESTGMTQWRYGTGLDFYVLPNTGHGVGMCSRAVYAIDLNSTYTHFFPALDGVNKYMRCWFQIGKATSAELNEWLKENPVTFIYQLATPEEIELSAEEMNQLKSVQTYTGITNIFNDDNADMYIKYWCDSNINALIGNKANQTDLTSHINNTTAHITSTERTNWNAAKNHADSTHARTDATKVEKSTTNGNIKINGTETVVYAHPTGTNPHGTTKSDVGLGNVPNVATNDQTPTYTDATTLATLTSGEKISVAFGKIKLAITNLINHIANKSNPHGVTKAQVGLGNVENKTSATIRGELTKENVTDALGYTPPTTNTTYSNFVKSGSGAKAGLVPSPSTTAGTVKYLCEDGTWKIPDAISIDGYSIQMGYVSFKATSVTFEKSFSEPPFVYLSGWASRNGGTSAFINSQTVTETGFTLSINGYDGFYWIAFGKLAE